MLQSCFGPLLRHILNEVNELSEEKVGIQGFAGVVKSWRKKAS